jgi:hypothetical protein
VRAVKWARDHLVDVARGDCVHLLHILPQRTDASVGYAYPMMGAPSQRCAYSVHPVRARAMSFTDRSTDDEL